MSVLNIVFKVRFLGSFLLITLLFNTLAQKDSDSAIGVYGDFSISPIADICQDPTKTLESHLEAEEMVEDILSKIGLTSNFLVAICDNIDNAIAINIPSDIGYIRYIYLNPTFFESLRTNTEGEWGLLSLLSHEIGHHLIGHTLDSRGSRPDVELEADEFSGFMLFMLGASLRQATELMSKYGSEKTSLTHPARLDRVLAIKKGYNNAEANLGKYRKANRHSDYTTQAKKMFVKAFQIEGDQEPHHKKRVYYYGRATEYRADYAEAWRNRAKYLNKLKLYDEARVDANRAISLDKDNWNAYSEKAVSYLGLKQYQKAIRIFNVPIEESGIPRPYDYMLRGWSYHKMGERDKAISDLEESIRLKPDLVEARRRLQKVKL